MKQISTRNAIPQVYLDFKGEYIKTSRVPFDLFHFAIPTAMNPNEGFHCTVCAYWVLPGNFWAQQLFWPNLKGKGKEGSQRG